MGIANVANATCVYIAQKPQTEKFFIGARYYRVGDELGEYCDLDTAKRVVAAIFEYMSNDRNLFVMPQAGNVQFGDYNEKG